MKRKRTRREDYSEKLIVAKKSKQPAETEIPVTTQSSSTQESILSAAESIDTGSTLPTQPTSSTLPTGSTLPRATNDQVKCRNFLASLLRLARKQSGAVGENVRELIQGLIESRIDLEIFTTRVRRELNWSASLNWPSFLKQSLADLQHSLTSGKLTLEGVAATSQTRPRLSDNIRSRIFDYSSEDSD